MKVCLLYKDSESGKNSCRMNRNEVIQDLNLDIIFKTMARSDKFIYQTVRSVMTNCPVDADTISYRQDIIKDFIQNYEGLHELYQLSIHAIEETEQFREILKKAATVRVSNAVSVLNSLQVLGILVKNLEEVKKYIDTIHDKFTSSGLCSFYDRLVNDYSDEFVDKIKASVNDMNFLTEGGEITFSASIGQGLKYQNLIVNHLVKENVKNNKPKGIVKLMYYKMFKRNTVILTDTDLIRDAREMEAAGLAHIMKMYQNFIRDLNSFFECLHYQTAFYIGCANLSIRLTQMRIPTAMPNMIEPGKQTFSFDGLYDLSLAIYIRSMPVCNQLNTEDNRLFLITGANQGGKSTFLRSIGIAQIMMQCGMFIPGKSYCSDIYDGIFTHFTRREDASMNSGKLDEELSRMNQILNKITPNSMLLMNESFATTTEREGSKIASDVVTALYENGTKVWLVTHLFEFTKAMFAKQLKNTLFLNAERLPDGTRTYRMIENEPERTSYGLDLYNQIICD